VASLQQKEEMVSAICKEIYLRKDYFSNERIETIYLGGRTPSVLTAGDIARIFDCLRNTFSISKEPEITMEGNPEDLSAEYLREVIQQGVNRLSIGIQSFCEEHLSYFGRHHTVQQAITSVQAAQESGFSNISIDLIYGFPGLTLDQWQFNVKAALELSPEHISAYQLMVEKGSVFFKRQQHGGFLPASDEESVLHYQELIKRLDEAGYEHYELSNFCKQGYESRHNSSYWFGFHYLGLGPAAHSFNGISRQWNSSNNIKYIGRINQGLLDLEEELLSEKDRFNELMVTRLRTKRGLYRQELLVFSPKFVNTFELRLAEMIRKGAIKDISTGWRIPEQYWLISDGIIEQMMGD